MLNDYNLMLLTAFEFFIVNFKSCYIDPESCRSCNMDYYLRISNETSFVDQGNGTLVNPYKQSKQIMESQYKI